MGDLDLDIALAPPGGFDTDLVLDRDLLTLLYRLLFISPPAGLGERLSSLYRLALFCGTAPARLPGGLTEPVPPRLPAAGGGDRDDR